MRQRVYRSVHQLAVAGPVRAERAGERAAGGAHDVGRPLAADVVAVARHVDEVAPGTIGTDELALHILVTKRDPQCFAHGLHVTVAQAQFPGTLRDRRHLAHVLDQVLDRQRRESRRDILALGDEVGIDDGKQRWKQKLGRQVSSSPAVGEGCLVIGAEGTEGSLYCFGAKK